MLAVKSRKRAAAIQLADRAAIAAAVALGIVQWMGTSHPIYAMIAAVIASVALMMAFAGPIGRFVSAHPTIKMLALSFLVLIGVLLIAGGFDHDVPKGYVYFALAFSVVVEMLNIRLRKRSKPVRLR